MKTAMQELIEEMEKMRDPKDLMETIPIDCVLDLIESKLEIEKQQIIEAYNTGNDHFGNGGDNYYNKTFKIG